MTILVFPSSLEAGARFADEAHRWRQRVVGASSVDLDPYASRYDAWVKLPYIGDDSFFCALRLLMKLQGIDDLYVPNAASFNLLETEPPSRFPDLSLIGEAPYKTEIRNIE